jgi:4-hydroxy-tetrahydrodipicolinate reductase
MGRATCAALEGEEGFALLACAARTRDDAACPQGCAWITPDSLAGPDGLVTLPADLVVIDVSVAAGTEQLLDILESSPRALVAATTGLTPDVEKRIEALAKRAAVLRSRNLSLGIAVLSAWLRALPAGARAAYDVDIVEHHHAAKKDAPSGTALALGALLEGVSTSRRSGGVQTHSIRGGTAPGTHEVVLSGEGEILTLGHTVVDRAVFARGALRAARFLHKKPPGLYSFEDALN